MPIARTILQKGDSFKMPERPREVMRYASDYATAEARPGAASRASSLYGRHCKARVSQLAPHQRFIKHLGQIIQKIARPDGNSLGAEHEDGRIAAYA